MLSETIVSLVKRNSNLTSCTNSYRQLAVGAIYAGFLGAKIARQSPHDWRCSVSKPSRKVSQDFRL
jgi:hypothetical protein